MKLQETELLRDALQFYMTYGECDTATTQTLVELCRKYTLKVNAKKRIGYLVIRGRRSGYPGQKNCDTSTRYTKAIKINKNRAEKYLGCYVQKFSDNTEMYWSVSFEADKPNIQTGL